LPQHARAVPSASPDVAPYLKPVQSAPRAHASDTLVSAKASAEKPAMAATKPTSLTPVVTPQEATLVATLDTSVQTDTEQRYAARDQAAQKQKTFQGGDAIVIGTGTIFLVLLILLIVLLVD
jgi:hypothetical protein